MSKIKSFQQANKWTKFVFNTVSPIYTKIDFINSTNYQDAIAFVNNEIEIKQKRILDIGTGTGDWGAMYLKYNASKVTGIDFANSMIEKGKSKNPNVSFVLANAEHLNQFKDASFEIVTASFVLHGVKSQKRKQILSEMKRISQKHIVLHDFVGYTPLFIQFLEMIERSDYQNFKKNILKELQEQFSRVWYKSIKKGTGIYIAEK